MKRVNKVEAKIGLSVYYVFNFRIVVAVFFTFFKHRNIRPSNLYHLDTSPVLSQLYHFCKSGN